MPYTIDVEGVGEVEVSDDITPLKAAEQLHQKFFRKPSTVTASSALQAPPVNQPESPQSINRFFAQSAVDSQDSPNMAGAKGAWESLITPQVNINRVQGSPDDPMIDKVSGGLYNAGAGLLEFFTSPIGIATAGLSALPVGVGKVAGGLFAADLSRALPEVAHGISEAVKAGDIQKATELGASGAVQLLAIGGGMKHAIGEGIPVRQPARPTSGLEGEPLIQPPSIPRTSVDVPVVEEPTLRMPTVEEIAIARAVPDEVAPVAPEAVKPTLAEDKAEFSRLGQEMLKADPNSPEFQEILTAREAIKEKPENGGFPPGEKPTGPAKTVDEALAEVGAEPLAPTDVKEVPKWEKSGEIKQNKDGDWELIENGEVVHADSNYSSLMTTFGESNAGYHQRITQISPNKFTLELADKTGDGETIHELIPINKNASVEPLTPPTPTPKPAPAKPVNPRRAPVWDEISADDQMEFMEAVERRFGEPSIKPKNPEDLRTLVAHLWEQSVLKTTVKLSESLTGDAPYLADKLTKKDWIEAQNKLAKRQDVKPLSSPEPAPVEPPKAEVKAVTKAVEKIKTQVSEVAAEEGQRSAKDIKGDIVSKIQKAITDAPSEFELAKIVNKLERDPVAGEMLSIREQQGSVTIHIPDDGTFEIKNTKEALGEILKRAQKINTSSSSGPSVKRRNPPKLTKEELAEYEVNPHEEPPPAEPKGPGLGGQRPGARTATPSAKPEAPESYEGTALKHAVDEMERAGHNFGGRPQQEIQPMLEAWIRSAKDPASNAKLARELIANPRRGLTGDESAMILRHKVALSNALNDAAEKTFTGKPEDKAFNRSEFDRASDELKTFMDAVNERGSEWGREGRWRQAVAYEDYTFATQERLLRAAKGGERLNDAEHTQLVKEVAEHKRLLEEAKKHAEGETGRQTKITEDAVKAVVEKYEKESGKAPRVHPDILDAARVIVAKLKARGDAASVRLKSKLANLNQLVPDPTIIKDIAEIGVGKLAEKAMDFAEWSKSMIEDYGPKVERFLKDAYDASKKLLADDLSKVKGSVKDQISRKARKGADVTEQKEVAIENIKHKVETGKLDELDPFIQKLTRLVIAEGAKGWREVTDRVHAILKDIVPDLDYRDTMRAISGHGEISGPKMDPISVEKSKVTGLIHKILQIQEVIGRRKVEGKGFQRGLTPDEQRRFNAIYNEAKRRFGIVNSESIVRSTLQSRETFYKNRLADLKHEIKTGKRIVRTKSPSPTSANLEKLQAEYEALKKEHDAIFPRPDLTDAQKLDLAEKAAARMEGEWNKKLADAKRGVFEDPSVQGWKAKSAKLEEIRARTDAAREQVKEMREATDQFKADKLEKDLARVEARSAVLEKEINEGFSEAKKAKKPIDEKLQAAIDERNQLNKMKGELQRAMKPKKSPEEIALQSYITRATNRLADLNAKNADLEAKLASGQISLEDIAPKPKRPAFDPSTDTNAMRLKAELSAVEKRIAQNRYEAHLKLRTLPRKIWDGIKQTPGAFINIVSSVDFSALRQALPAILSLSTRPIRGWPELAKGVGRMFSSAFSEQRALMIEQQIQNRKNARSGADKIMGLDFTELNATKFTKYEDAAHSVLDEWAKLPYKTGKLGKTIATAPAKVLANVVRGSNRAFVTFLNSTRASLADELLRANYSKEAPTPAQLREVGYLTNLATGRGELDPMTARVAAKVVWSPNLLASRVKLATGMPLWRALKTKNPKAIKIVAEEYARVIISGYLLGQVAMLFDDKEGEPSTSSDYGKIVRGSTRIDIWGGFQQITVAGSRVAQGVTTSLKGKTQDITKGKFGVDTALDVGVRFGRSKLRPDWSILVNVLDRQDFIGRNTNIATEEGLARVAESLVPIPLSLHEITSVMKERGFTEGMIIQALSAFGAGVSNYEGKEVQR